MAAVANASATIKSNFHPQHPLTRYHYNEASNYPCAACERVVTGAGYSCDACNFNIHEACLGLPGSINFGQHREHELTLRRLGVSRWCDVCRETSPAGCYIYHCSPCNYDVHPRCVPGLPLAAGGGGAAPDQPQPPRGARRRHGGGVVRLIVTTVKIVLHVVHVIHNPLHVVHLVHALAQ